VDLGCGEVEVISSGIRYVIGDGDDKISIVYLGEQYIET